ncbi:MFS general substrate transporter [Microthyrium microscopicum]|uniref:MFS general substrate transporter n=1 Tax=Microthyrium microscopicum TaxID=703497 RepID=A0A6A6UAT6_9PEZI|nr:MFS general substrate transporter [Microthyrium microscopicum]
MVAPSDVGWRPWIQVLGGWLLMFNSWGMLHSFGAFQDYYVQGGLIDQSSPYKIAWIGSLQAFLLLGGGALTGKIVDHGYFRWMISYGTLMAIFGMLAASFCKQYVYIIITQGLWVGLGMSLFLVPSVAIPRQWFEKRRGLALGIVTTGSSSAGLVYPIVVYDLVPRIGFPWTLRIVTGIQLVTLLAANLIMRPRLKPNPVREVPLFDYPALRNPQFAFYVAGMFATFLGYFMFFNNIVAWTLSEQLLSANLAIYLLPMANAGSIVGRISTNFMADHWGPLNVQVPAIALAGATVLAWICVHSVVPTIILAVLYGFFSGALVSLPNTAVAGMTQNIHMFGARIGVVFLAMGSGSLIGAPTTGALLQGIAGQPGSYTNARLWSGLTMLVGSALVFISRMFATKWKWRAKA